MYHRLERLQFGTSAGKAKVFGTIMGLGGATLFTLYKGFSLDFLKSGINLVSYTSGSNIALPARDHHVLGGGLALAGCFSFSIWIIIQVSNMHCY